MQLRKTNTILAATVLPSCPLAEDSEPRNEFGHLKHDPLLLWYLNFVRVCARARVCVRACVCLFKHTVINIIATTHDLAVCVNLWYYIVNVLIPIWHINFVLTCFIGVFF